MTKLLAGALALALIGGSTAVAQPDSRDHAGDSSQSADRQAGDRGGQDRGGDRGDHSRDRHHMVCKWRHHHRVCYHQHW